jgi:hypothetical protein
MDWGHDAEVGLRRKRKLNEASPQTVEAKTKCVLIFVGKSVGSRRQRRDPPSFCCARSSCCSAVWLLRLSFAGFGGQAARPK